MVCCEVTGCGKMSENEVRRLHMYMPSRTRMSAMQIVRLHMAHSLMLSFFKGGFGRCSRYLSLEVSTKALIGKCSRSLPGELRRFTDGIDRSAPNNALAVVRSSPTKYSPEAIRALERRFSSRLLGNFSAMS